MRSRWAIILISIGLVLGCAYIAADLWLEEKIRIDLCKLVQDEHFYHNCTDLKVDLGLLSGDVRLTGIRSIQRTDSTSGSSIAGDLDTLELNGLSYYDLITNKRLHFSEAVVRFSDAVIYKRKHDHSDTVRSSLPYGELIVDRVSIHATRIKVTLPDKAYVQVAEAMFSCNDLKIIKRGPDSPLHYAWRDVRTELSIAQLTPFLDGELYMEQVVIDGKMHTALIHGIRAGAVSELEKLASKVPIERDIISMKIDTIGITGFDDHMFMDHESAWRHQKLRIVGATIEVVRDKLRPDAPYALKPLPAEMIRMLPRSSGVDTISFAGVNVTYRERNDAKRGFARFPFRDIEGTIVNVRNDTIDPGDMTIDARAIVFKDTPVRLSLATNVADASNAIKLKATVGRMAFADLMVTTSALTGVATQAGHINSITMYMNGSEHRAAARMWMRYEGLKLRVRSKKNIEKQNIALTAALNLLVKGDRAGDKEGDGWVDYGFDRRRDRSIFNYLWSGVREGAKTSMLPGFATK